MVELNAESSALAAAAQIWKFQAQGLCGKQGCETFLDCKAGKEDKKMKLKGTK